MHRSVGAALPKFGKTFINQLRHLTLFPNFCRVKRLLQYLTLNTFVSIQRVKCFIAVCTNPIGFFQQHILPKRQSNFIRHLYVVVQLVWIAAFLVSTKFEHFRCQPPGKISYCCFGAPVLCTGALFCTLFLIRKRLRPYRCRSPPSDFDFCHQLKHRNWRKLL